METGKVRKFNLYSDQLMETNTDFLIAGPFSPISNLEASTQESRSTEL